VPFIIARLLALIALLELLLILLGILLGVIARLTLLLWLLGGLSRLGGDCCGLMSRLLLSKCLNIAASLPTVFHFAD
jgi:hypothetical protein